MKARYRKNAAHRGNPFIEAMPPFLSREELFQRIRSVPPAVGDKEREAPANFRMESVRKLPEVFLPMSYSYVIYDLIYQGIMSSFMTKGTIESIKQIIHLKESCQKEGAVEPYTTQAVSYSILGVPGVGKTSCIQRILSVIPQVVEHSSYKNKPFLCKQINHITIQCPSDCSVKAACIYILGEIDRLVGTEYYTRAERRMLNTVDALVAQISILCMTHHIGTIIIDEIQNVVARKQNGGQHSRLIRFLVQLMNDTGICVILVGTPDIEAFFDSADHLARRTRGIRIAAMDYGDEFRELLDCLWALQYTRRRTKLTPSISALLYDMSGGRAGLLVNILDLAQRQAILSGREKIDEKAIRETADIYKLGKAPEWYENGTSAFTIDGENPNTITTRAGRPKAKRSADDMCELLAKYPDFKEFYAELAERKFLYGPDGAALLSKSISG